MVSHFMTSKLTTSFHTPRCMAHQTTGEIVIILKKHSKAKIASEIALNLNFHQIKIKLVLLCFFFFFDKSENRDLSLQTSSQEPRHLAILIIVLINIYFKPNLLRKCLTWPLLSLLQTNGIKLKILQVAGVLRYFGSFPV